MNMAVSPSSLDRGTPFTQPGKSGFGQAGVGQSASSGLSLKWSALQDSAAVVAMLAGLDPELSRPEIRNFPALIRSVGGWRQKLAGEQVDELMGIMEAGISALLAAQARGIMPVLAAKALWQEFIAARQAMLGLLPNDQATRAFA